MFFIFGWNHTKVTEHGPVQEEKCPNCHNTDVWQLKTVSRHFTLFFIPVFLQDKEHLYYCPICNFGLKPDREDFESYKSIVQANIDCAAEKITDEEWSARLDEIHAVMQERKQHENLKHLEESKKWEAVVAEKSSTELQQILDKKSGEYNPAFIIAAKAELEKRMGSN